MKNTNTWREIIRVVNLITLSIVLYRTDIKSIIDFAGLIALVMWVIPEIAIFIAKQWKE